MADQQMTTMASLTGALPALKTLQREAGVGLTIGLTLLSASLAGGVVVAGPLGIHHLAFGAGAAVAGAVFGGACATLVASSSFILWAPQVTIALVQASLVSTLAAEPAFSRDPAAVITALLVCIVLAGILQVGVALAGIARVVKYVPHPVVAGFVNGVSASIFLSQIKQFHPSIEAPLGVHPAMLAFVVALVAFVFWFEARTKKIPAPLTGLLAGIAGYHVLRFAAPQLDLGVTLGRLPIKFPPIAPISNLALPETRQMLIGAAPHIISIAVAIVIVGTMQSLLAFRMAEKLANTNVPAGRGLLALGFGDIVSAAAGGLAVSVGAPMTAAAFRSGGRTRAVGLTASLGLFLLTFAVPDAFGAIPLAAIVALLFVVSISSFDRWSVRSTYSVLRLRAADEGLRIYYDLAVVLTVMILTVTVSIVVGIVAGIAMTCLTFVINMSQPIIRRRLSGANVRSKRVRTATEAEVLRERGAECMVLQLSGVLFFGNADALAREVTGAPATATAIVLDCRGITDIDVTGANIIRDIIEKSRKSGKRLLLCNLPADRRKPVSRIVDDGKEPTIFNDLDSTLEWIENRVLREFDDIRKRCEPLRLEEHDLVRALDDEGRSVLASLLVEREFAKGERLAAEGEPGDRMWLIMKGAVDIRLRVDDLRGTRRIASLGAGTTVGEMSLIENEPRSANIIAADDLVCLELDRRCYETMLQRHPHIATQILTNLMREMAHRIRNTSEQLRETES